MKGYIIYTQIDGTNFFICEKDNKFYVESKPADSEIMILENLEEAERIAKENSVDGIFYKIKNLSELNFR